MIITKKLILKYSSTTCIYYRLSSVTIRTNALMQMLWNSIRMFRYQTIYMYSGWVQLSRWYQHRNEKCSYLPQTVYDRKKHVCQQTNDKTLHLFVGASIQLYGMTADICKDNITAFITTNSWEVPCTTSDLFQITELKLIAVSARERLTKQHLDTIEDNQCTKSKGDFQMTLNEQLRSDLRAKTVTINNLTRDTSAIKFLNNELWYHGPT